MKSNDYAYSLELHSLLTSGRVEKEGLFDLLTACKIECSRTLSSAYSLILFDERIEKKELITIVLQIKNKAKKIIGIDFSKIPTPLHLLCELKKNGVDELLPWKWKKDIGKIILNRLTRWKIIERDLNSDYIQQSIIGASGVLKKTLTQAIEVARFSNLPVLVNGESGTGKESLARLVHHLDRRPDKQGLVLLDCTTISRDLSGSEFFGHEKGAFTNAIENRDGAFALANKGTLFLDEIGELPLNLQAELLRAIQEKSYKRVGSNHWRKTDFRLVSATNRDLKEEVKAARFRLDLFHRLNACVLTLPSLRERKLDIPDLANYFLKQALHSDEAPPLTKSVLHFLLAKDYPGNIRELKNLVDRIAYRYTGEGPITLGCIPESDLYTAQIYENDWLNTHFENSLKIAIANGIGLKEIKRLTANLAMDIAIEASNENLKEAATILEVTPRTLQVHQASKKE